LSLINAGAVVAIVGAGAHGHASHCMTMQSQLFLGPERACKVRARVGLGLLRAWPGLVGGLGVWPAGLPQKPGPHGLGLLGYVVKARVRAWAWARSGLSCFHFSLQSFPNLGGVG
jgi:hypothetical protein